MARQQTLVQLTDELIAALDERVARSGRSRSELIRAAIEGFLKNDRDAQIDHAIRAGYERVPPAEADWAVRAGQASIAAEPW